jgi:hypothetical protein
LPPVAFLCEMLRRAQGLFDFGAGVGVGGRLTD